MEREELTQFWCVNCVSSDGKWALKADTHVRLKMMQKGVNSRYRSALKNDAVCLIKRDTAGAVKTNAVVRQKLTLLSVGRPPPHRPQPRRRQIRYSVVIFLANVALSGLTDNRSCLICLCR